MKNIRKTQTTVERVLQEHPETRGSDDLLYVAVCRELNPTIGHFTFAEVLQNRTLFDIPPYESVGRARRKLQMKNPEYRPSDDVVAERTLLETNIRAYAHE